MNCEKMRALVAAHRGHALTSAMIKAMETAYTMLCL